MKKIRIFLLLLIFCLILLPVNKVQATEHTANNYEDLKEILENQSDATIVLSDDITIEDDPGITIKNNQNITIDLNGHTLSMESNIKSTSYLIKNNGNLTIKDSTDINKNGTGNGKITYLSTVSSEAYAYACNTISNYGTLILESGLIENNTPNAHADYCVDNYSNNSLIKMNGGKLFSLESWGIRMFVNSNTNGNDLEINSGEIEGGVWLQVPSSKLDPKANVTINNGKIYGRNYAFYVYDTETINGRNIDIKINGGDFAATNAEKGRALFIDYDTHMNIEINGGTFTGKYSMIYYSGVQSETPNININDGVFNGKININYDFSTNKNENYNSNIVINNGKFSDDICVWAYDEENNDNYFSTNTKFIKNGYFAKICDEESDENFAWINYVVDGFEATGKMKTTPAGYPYTIGHKITLDLNYDDQKEVIYTLRNGSMSELYDCEREGYKFLSWNTKQDGTGTTVTNKSTINEDTTLYAQWELIPGDVKVSINSEESYDIKIGTEELYNAILTEEDQKSIEDGKNILIEVVTKNITEEISDEDKDNIINGIKDKNVGVYIDISMIKKVDGEEATNINETNEEVEITINIPKELLSKEAERQYYIVRAHDGKVEIIDSTYDSTNNTIKFKTNKFSVYAIAYSDVEHIDNTNTPNSEETTQKESTDVNNKNKQEEQSAEEITKPENKVVNNEKKSENNKEEQSAEETTKPENKVANNEKKSENNKEEKVKDGKNNTSNPNTGDNIVVSIIVFTISIVGIFLIINTKKKTSKKI